MHYALHTYGYDIKMGIIDKEVALLVPIQEKVYAYSYLPENGKKYYLFTAGEKPSATPVRTLPSLSRNKQRPFSLAITEPMLLAEDYRDTNRTYRDCSLNSPVNQNRISFFNDMPHTDLAVYADMPVDVAFAENTCQGLGSRIAPLSREDALNFYCISPNRLSVTRQTASNSAANDRSSPKRLSTTPIPIAKTERSSSPG